MIKVPEGLSPGDTIVDAYGDPIINHLVLGVSALCIGRKAFKMVANGEISVEAYVNNSHLRAEAELAYSRGETLPEGVTIEPGSEETMAWIAEHTVKR